MLPNREWFLGSYVLHKEYFFIQYIFIIYHPEQGIILNWMPKTECEPWW